MSYSLENIIECLLLVSDEPLTVNQIVKILDDKKITKKDFLLIAARKKKMKKNGNKSA